MGVQVHRQESQLIEPAGAVSVFIHIPSRLTGAHGNAQQLASPQAHGPGQRGHVAVVAHSAGNIPADLPHRPAHKRPAMAVELRRRHIHKQAGTANFAVNDHPGGGNAHGIHPGQMRRRGAERGRDVLIVIAQVAVQLGLPYDLLGPDRLPIYHRRGLAVTAA